MAIDSLPNYWLILWLVVDGGALLESKALPNLGLD